MSNERAKLNLDTDELDTLARLAAAQREVKAVADELLRRKTSTKDQRHAFGRRLNGVASSLRTVEMRLGGEL